MTTEGANPKKRPGDGKAGEANDFPVVGIGASAGGLDAFRRLLKSMPDDAGIAFILIQHLDPNHESMMVELLSRHTKMPVREAEDAMPLERNTVYMIPPGKFLKLVDHGLFLDEPIQSRGMRLPIDYFFRSLAEVRGERSIGIVLSGTGSDGTLGIKEIKAAGGMAMVQKAASAEYDGMPRSAIATGMVDYVLPIDEMPDRLLRYVHHPYLEPKNRQPDLSESAPDHFKSILSLMQVHTDHDFRCYKKATLNRRIHRRMGLRQIEKLDDYLRLLRENEAELHLLIKDLLIGVTRFFREPDSWKMIVNSVLTPLIESKTVDEPLRAWIPGCATGEEAYTLAMLAVETLETHQKSLDIQIFATDLDADSIAAARAGIYPASISSDVSPTRLKRFFQDQGDHYRIGKRLRESIIFAAQNMISDPPFSKLDMISCRNLLIYLEPDVQRRMIEMFHFALAPGGYLFLGSSESAERPARLFDAVSKADRIYRRSDKSPITQRSFPVKPDAGNGEITEMEGRGRRDGVFASTVEMAKRTLLERFVPASVLINRRFDIQYFHGPLRNYLDFPSGEPTSELPSIAIEALRPKLRSLLTKVQHEKRADEVVVRNVPRNGHTVAVRLRAEPLAMTSEREPAILVSFEDDAPARKADGSKPASDADATSTEDDSLVNQLQYELMATREDLQSTIEELETSNEELKASNEEAMSMNEELQSTNEELETSREELQSLNEELTTINNQLEDKVDELEATNNDLINLLSSTDTATLFLDTDLCIRRFNPATRELLRVIDGDVGRPISDLAPRVNDPSLLDDARKVLAKLQPSEATLRGDDGVTFMRRILPYRTSENAIEGVVVTVTDVSNLQQVTDRLEVRERQQAAVTRLGEAALAGAALQDLFEQAVKEITKLLGVGFAKVLELEPDGRRLLLRAGTGWKKVKLGKTTVDGGLNSQAGFTLQRSSAVIVEDLGKEKRFSGPKLLTDHGIISGMSVVIGPVDRAWGVLGAHENHEVAFTIDDTHFLQAVANILWLAISTDRAQALIEAERRELRQLADALPFQIAIVGPDQRYRFNNEAYKEWGRKPSEVEGQHVRDVLGEKSYEDARPMIEAALDGEPQSFQLAVQHPGEKPRVNFVTYRPRESQTGEREGFYSAAIEITDLCEAQDAAAASERRLNLALDGAKMGTWEWDPETDNSTWDDRLNAILGLDADEDQQGKMVFDNIHPDDLDVFWSAIRECTDGSGVYRSEFRYNKPDGELIWLAGYGARFEIDGKMRLAGVNFDITARKSVEERNKVISAELDHRVKNLLATVNSIARMTGQNAGSIEAYRESFEARIQAMSRTHSALARAHWDGIELKELLELELSPYADQLGEALAIEGPAIILRPNAAQTISLAFHELATNAAKYGALSREGGKLEVTWSLTEAKGRQRIFALTWKEKTPFKVAPPTSKGFGSTVVEEVVQAQLSADVDWRFASSGIIYKLKVVAELLTAA